MAGSLFSDFSRNALWAADFPSPSGSRYSFLEVLILTTGGGIITGALALWLSMRTASLFLLLNGVFVLILGLVWLIRSRLSLRGIRLLLFFLFWVHYSVMLVFTGGVHSPAAGMLLILIYVSGLLLGLKGSLASILLGTGSLTGVLWAEQAGFLPSSSLPQTPVMEIAFHFMIGTIFIVVVNFTNRLLANYQHSLQAELKERKVVQDALVLQSGQMQMVLEKSFDAFILIDENGRVAEWNPGAERLLGYTRAEMRGQRMEKVIEKIALPAYHAPPSLSKLLNALEQALKRGKSPFFNRKVETRFLHASGEVKTCELNSFALPTAQGFRIGMVLRDVTAEREVREQLRLRLRHLKTLNRLSTLSREEARVSPFLEKALDLLLPVLDVPAGGVA
uniref:PAS domain S-box protein n=1 Tax=Anaerolinea sp. TaxID=1872519 RepID=UPI002ACD2EC3